MSLFVDYTEVRLLVISRLAQAPVLLVSSPTIESRHWRSGSQFCIIYPL